MNVINMPLYGILARGIHSTDNTRPTAEQRCAANMLLQLLIDRLSSYYDSLGFFG